MWRVQHLGQGTLRHSSQLHSQLDSAISNSAARKGPSERKSYGTWGLLSAYLLICLPANLFTCPSAYLFTCLPVNFTSCLFAHLSTCVPAHLTPFPPTYLPTCLPAFYCLLGVEAHPGRALRTFHLLHKILVLSDIVRGVAHMSD